MEPNTLHLSQIETRWTMIFQAHDDDPDAVSTAQKQLMDRYCGAVHRYLLGVTRDPEAAEDLTQEFALRFLRGDFRRVDPSRGRFRDYLKTTVLNLVTDARRRQRLRPRPLSAETPELTEPGDDLADIELRFFDCCREELLARAWNELAKLQDRTGQPFYTVLRFRVDHPKLHSPEIASQLSERLGKPVSAGWVRQVLLRAREKYTQFVLNEVAQSMEHAPTSEQLDEELLNLGLREYCRANRTYRVRGA